MEGGKAQPWRTAVELLCTFRCIGIVISVVQFVHVAFELCGRVRIRIETGLVRVLVQALHALHVFLEQLGGQCVRTYATLISLQIRNGSHVRRFSGDVGGQEDQ